MIKDIKILSVIITITILLYIYTFSFDEVPEILAQGMQPTMMPRLIFTLIVFLSLFQIYQNKNLLDEKGGFISAHWDGTAETEEKIKNETKATIRCIPIERSKEDGLCIYSGKPSRQRVLFAKAY